MSSSYSSSYRFELPDTGDRSGTWGQMMNQFMGTLLEDALSGVSSVVMANADYTLVTASGSVDETRRMILNVTSSIALSQTRNVIAPSVKKLYSILNNTTGSQSIVIKTSAGVGVTVPSGKRRFVFCDGTDFYDLLTDLPSGATIANSAIATTTSAQGLSNKTITASTITVADNAFTLQDNGDATKQVVFELSGLTTGQTRTLTVPDASATLATTTTAQTLQNKTLDNTNILTVRDDRLTLQDNADATKQVVFELSGLTAGTTRTVSVADGSFTVGGTIFNAQTGTSYTVQASDRADILTFSNAAAVSVTLPQATTAGFGSGFFFFVKNLGVGTVTITPATSTIAGGSALVLRTDQWAIVFSDSTNYNTFHTGSVTGALSAKEIGTRGLPVVTQDAAYQFALGDEGGIIRHSSASVHTYTIPANGTTPFAVGTAFTIVNEPGGGDVTLAITTDTLNRGDGVAGTGSRTIKANSVATVIKTAATTWMITGSFI